MIVQETLRFEDWLVVRRKDSLRESHPGSLEQVQVWQNLENEKALAREFQVPGSRFQVSCVTPALRQREKGLRWLNTEY
jgi:hypothetical protein